VQKFQLDDDLGDSAAPAPGYGGKVCYGNYRKAGSIWAAAAAAVKIWVFAEGQKRIALRVDKPDEQGSKSNRRESHRKTGTAFNTKPLYLEFKVVREGYHQLSAKLMEGSQSPARVYLKVEYEAPAASDKF
jgi:alpha-amylase